MAARFRRSKGSVVVKFDPAEAAVLAALFSSLADLLADSGPVVQPGDDPLENLLGGQADGAAPEDPVLGRLFPAAYQDPDAAAEFRRLTEVDLRSAKLANATEVRDRLVASGGRFSLDTEQAERWLSALNDLRLAMGTRLGVTEETPEELESRAREDPQAAQLHIYEWLGYLQETLVRCLLG
jgi:hypothetical protein